MAKNLKNWQGTLCIFGADWGDSGKGRMIDDLAQKADVVARWAGGSNTGHTVENDFGKFALHIMPSGIFNKKALCLIGRNVAVDLESLTAEVDTLERAGVSCRNLIIDQGASITMPWHRERDNVRESLRKSKIGTTGHGVGPTYADRTERVGLRVSDLAVGDFKSRLEEETRIQNKFYGLNLESAQVYKKYKLIFQKIKPYIGDTISVLNNYVKSKKNILFEGAQGWLLDLDAGTYPFVTSSNPGVLGIWRCFDLHPSDIKNVIGITKAYATRVGEGPMPTEILDKNKDLIIEKGKEFGTTTGRARRPGWLDLVLIKAAHKANKLTGIAVTKLDVLSGFGKVKICVGYKLGNQSVDYRPNDADFLAKVRPVYDELAGWSEDISRVRKFTDLPKNAKGYIRKIEDYVGVTVRFISVGPKRGEVIYT